MNYRNLLSSIIIVGIISIVVITNPKDRNNSSSEVQPLYLTNVDLTENSPPCLQMYYALEKYSEEYNIPKRYAYGIAYSETHYEGPFHWKYKATQTSSVGAIGPMQIMLPTGKGLWPDTTVTRDMLMNDIDFNVESSMKLLHKLYNKYKDWKLVFGCYNTGRPMVNGYAEKVYHFEYKFKQH